MLNEMGLEMHDMFRGGGRGDGSPFGHSDGREKHRRAHRISFQVAREICNAKETEDIHLGLKETRDQ